MSLAELLCMAVLSVGMPNADFACYHMHTVVEAAEQSEIDPAIFVALIYVESRWSPKAVSRSGACGLTQIMPRWSTDRKRSIGKRLTCQQLFEPEISIRRGAKILAYWFHKYGKKRYKTALCGYNAGFRCKGKSPYPRGVAYAKKVLRYAKKIKKEVKLLRKYEEEEVPGCMLYE
jgi:soluble lytic murein transglycosylase-like protein